MLTGLDLTFMGVIQFTLIFSALLVFLSHLWEKEEWGQKNKKNKNKKKQKQKQKRKEGKGSRRGKEGREWECKCFNTAGMYSIVFNVPTPREEVGNPLDMYSVS